MSTVALHVVCPHCDSVNRVPQTRLHDAPQCGVCHDALFAGRPVALDDSRIDRHIGRSDLPVVVDFWAPWCGPCRTMASVFEQATAATEPRARFGKVNTEAQPALASCYGIRSIPTLIVFQRGQEIARHSGAMPPSAFAQWLSQYC